jgi:predicted dehydrogenase
VRPVRLGIVGTGLIGRVHAVSARGAPTTELVAVCGIDAGAGALADELGVPLCADYRTLTEHDVEGVVVAVPNHLHLEIAAHFAAAGVHLLVEKPIADTVAAGRELCSVAEQRGVHLLIGHQRRHSSLVEVAADAVAHSIGRVVAIDVMVTMRKPDSYYATSWRRRAGAGPLLVNLVHDVDLVRAVCGEIDCVQAFSTRLGRAFDFDDTAAVLLQFRNGALGTMVLSESTPSPWSWEASAGESLGFHHAGRDYLRVLGDEASLSFPSVTLWSYDAADGEPGWSSPLHARRMDVRRNDAYLDQLVHFAGVVRGVEPPRVPGQEGLRSLAVVAAVIEATRRRAAVDVDEILLDG